MEETLVIGTIRSTPVMRSDNGESGVYELLVTTGKTFFHSQPDKRDYILRLIAMHLERCVISTGIEAGAGHWTFRFEREIAFAINEPLDMTL